MSASISDKITDVRNGARPNSARVASPRTIGGTTLVCDNLAGWPTASKVHFVTYQVDTNNDPVAGTQIDCVGIVSGNSIGSFAVIDGTDSGNSVNDVVEMLPTASWGQDLADALTAEHDRDGTHAAITATSLATNTITEGTAASGVTIDSVLLKDGKVATSGAVENTAVMTGMPVQMTSVGYSAVATGSTVLPQDDTIPQNTEGDEYMSLAITPKSATNILVIEVTALLSGSAAGSGIGGAIFQDSTANALAAGQEYMATATGRVVFRLVHRMVAGTTSATTFKFRAGPDAGAGGTITFNGSSATRLFGAIPKSAITITEYKAA